MYLLFLFILLFKKQLDFANQDESIGAFFKILYIPVGVNVNHNALVDYHLNLIKSSKYC